MQTYHSYIPLPDYSVYAPVIRDSRPVCGRATGPMSRDRTHKVNAIAWRVKKRSYNEARKRANDRRLQERVREARRVAEQCRDGIEGVVWKGRLAVRS